MKASDIQEHVEFIEFRSKNTKSGIGRNCYLIMWGSDPDRKAAVVVGNQKGTNWIGRRNDKGLSTAHQSIQRIDVAPQQYKFIIMAHDEYENA